MDYMGTLHGYTYKLVEKENWKFGGTLHKGSQISEFDSVDGFDSEEKAHEAMVEYCQANGIELQEKK